MSSPALIPVSAISRTMASSRRSRKSLPPHALRRRRSSSSVSDSVTLASSLGDLRPSKWSASISPSSSSHAEKRRTPSWRARAVAGSAPPSRRSATKPFTRSRSRAGVWPLSSHHADECAHTVAVAFDGLRCFCVRRAPPVPRRAAGRRGRERRGCAAGCTASLHHRNRRYLNWKRCTCLDISELSDISAAQSVVVSVSSVQVVAQHLRTAGVPQL